MNNAQPHSAQLIEEWKSLREEVARKQSFVERLVLTTVTGNLAIFAFACTQKDMAPVNAFLALLGIVLTSLSYFWILKNLYSGFRIAAYIREYIEPHTGLNWETWLLRSRSASEPLPKHPPVNDFFRVFHNSLLYVALVVSIVLIWVPLYSKPPRGVGQILPYLGLTVAAVFLWLAWNFTVRRFLIAPLNHESNRLSTVIRQPGGPR